MHGIVAAAGLRHALEAGGKLLQQFLRAISRGHIRSLQLDLCNCEAGTAESLQAVVAALDPETIEELEIKSAEFADGNWMDAVAGHRKFKKLKRLKLWLCSHLKSLPENIWEQMGQLQVIDLGCCSELGWLPPGLERLTSLRELNLWKCPCAQSIPENVVRSLQAQGCVITISSSGY